MRRREPRRRSTARRIASAAALAGTIVAVASPAPAIEPPPTLAVTGLYADFESRRLATDVEAFSPQYPLWTDGAEKRRWIFLPPGSTIDATDPDFWSLPAGTRLWKEFAFERPVETRYMERLADGSWLYATYVWSDDGAAATLAPARGVRGAAESAPGVRYDVPAVTDCRACHGGHPSAALGFSALQLSPDRDPLAPHAAPPPPGALDLARLIAERRIVGLPEEIATRPPRVHAGDPVERAALGYLHGNCSSCHNARGPLDDLGLSFTVRADGEPEALATAVARPARYQPAGAPEMLRISPGDPDGSLLLRRLGSRQPLLQMPPMSTKTVDAEAVDLITTWILSGRPAHAVAGPGPTLAARVAAPTKEKLP